MDSTDPSTSASRPTRPSVVASSSSRGRPPRASGRRASAVVAVLASALAGLASTPPARAADGGADLEQARREFEALQYDRALESLDRALRAGGAAPDDVAEIERLAAEASVALGRPREAEERFLRLLALRPGHRLRAGASPKLAQPFDAARARLAARGPLAARAARAAGGAEIVVRVVSDPLAMVAGASVHRPGRGRPPLAWAAAADPIVLELPIALDERLTVAILDRHGNRLVELEVPPPADAAAVVAEGAARPRRPRPIHARWLTWAAPAVAGLAAGAGLGAAMRATEGDLRALVDDSAAHDWEEARALEERGRREALLANVCLGAGAALGLVSISLWIDERLDRRRGEGAARGRVRVGPAAAASPAAGPGLSLEVAF